LLLEGGDLPALMARVREECGPEARIVRAERVRSGGVAGFFAREHYELTVEVPVSEPPAARGIDALVDAADDDELALAGAAPAGAAPAGAAPVEPRVSTAGAAFADVLDQVRALAGPAAAVPTVAAAVAMPADPAPARALAAVPAPAGSPVVRSLRALGVPERLLAHGPTLAGVLAAIEPPPAPRRGPGEPVALVGAAAAVERLAAVLAGRWALEDAWVVRLGTIGRGAHRLPDPEAVTRWRAKAAAAAHPWLVVVPVGPEPADRGTAAALVAAADPATLWALVDARTRVGDARRWLDQVGALRAVDALAVDGVLDTAEPGCALDLGRPVALVDGMPANRVAWAAALGQDVDAARAPRTGTPGSSG